MRTIKLIGVVLLWTAWVARGQSSAPIAGYADGLNDALINYYIDPQQPIDAAKLAMPAELRHSFDAGVVRRIDSASKLSDTPTTVATIRGLLQQACTLNMAAAVRRGDLAEAQRWRCELMLPRGVSAADGALLLQTLGSQADKREDAARILTREAITWQTTRVRQLFAQAIKTSGGTLEMPGRIREELAEATTLAAIPPAVMQSAGLEPMAVRSVDADRDAVAAKPWGELRAELTKFRNGVESQLPSLLTDKERSRQERLLLKLVMLAPGEYGRGVRDGKVAVPLEYREAVSFTAQARQMLGELTPAWLSHDAPADRREAVEAIDKQLEQADDQITHIATPDEVAATMKSAEKVLQDKLGINLSRRGTTADIVDEVMLETRTLLNQSLNAAVHGDWKEAERLRLEAYTTYDPELEARLMPRDPQLATDIERLLLDGIKEPGVKATIDAHADATELNRAYADAHAGLEKAAAMLKSGISPTAAVVNASSIVLREGLEGLLVIVAILAGLRGEENRRKRNLFWLGIAASMGATAITWILSQTLIQGLRAYGEVIEAVAGLIAIFVLLLITNWLFHQIYWKQWISTLKTQAAEGESVWALVMAGFAVGYREGFETVLFLQSLILDAGGTTVSIGVIIGCAILVALGVSALKLGLKLPYFKLLLVTAGMIGLVLITFTGTTVRAMQTVGWMPIHRLLPGGSWPNWMGNWFGLQNTWESIGGQVAACALVVGTWRLARMQSKRKRRARECNLAEQARTPIAACAGIECAASETESQPVQVTIHRTSAPQPAPLEETPEPAQAM